MDDLSAHIEDVFDANLASPIFVTEDYQIVDGGHRVAKAFILGLPVPSIILTQEEIDKTRLEPEENYVGQIYRDDGDREHSVTDLIRLYRKKPAIPLDARMLVSRNEDVWGDTNIKDVIAAIVERGLDE